MHKRLSLVILAAALGMTAAAQTAPNWDTSGNTMLSGTYYFRHVLWVVGYDSGDLGDGISVYGTITFTPGPAGSPGSYTTSATVMDPSVATAPKGPSNFPGTYNISASGYGFIDNEYSQGDEIYGLVSNGVFIGSSTENQFGYNDLFIAVPVGSPLPTVSSLNGNYTIVGMDNPQIGQGGSAYALDYQLSFSANGAGKITAINGPLSPSGSASATGYIAGFGTATSQPIGTVSYTASNGAFQLQFPGTLNGTNLIAGGHFMYMSPDGNFIFGGSPNGWDMFVGVKAGGSSAFSGLYYQAGLDLDSAALAQAGYAVPDSYYGSMVGATSSYLFHQRQSNVFNGAYDYTSDDALTATSSGATQDNYLAQIYLPSGNGTYRIGIGSAPFLGIQVAVKAPSLTGSGVYVNPQGIQNSGNSALFTAGISPGAVILINGSGFGSGPSAGAGQPLSNKIGGTQVMIDSMAAPLVYVTPTLIAAQVPFEIATTTSPVIGIQVVTTSGSSNVVTLFESEDCSTGTCVGAPQPGVYTTNGSGLGFAAINHITKAGAFVPVTTSNPAVANETLVAYVNGLGTVSPSVGTGQPDTSVTASTTLPIFADFVDPNTGNVFPAGVTSTVCSNQASADAVFGAGCPVVFSGLAPPYAALYQVNIAVPSTDGFGDALPSGNLVLEFQSLDSTSTYVETYASQAVVPVSGASSSGVSADHPHRALHPMLSHRSLNTHRKTRILPKQKVQ